MRMNRLHPGPTHEVDTLDAYAVPDGPHLRVNMVASVDGAATVDGRVGVLSGTADQVLLRELRTLCDVLLVGAGTVRAEGYGPIRLGEEEQDRRIAAGLAPLPRLAVLTRSLDLDFAAPVFTRATVRPLVVATEQATTARRRAAEEVADVMVAGDQSVDLASALGTLREHGLARVLSEGGPHVLAEMFAADLVDELCLAIAPVVTAGDELRVTAGPALTVPKQVRLAHVLERDGFLFLRYTR